MCASGRQARGQGNGPKRKRSHGRRTEFVKAEPCAVSAPSGAVEEDRGRAGAQPLDAVAAELNGRPRKTLGWETTAERLHTLLTTASH